MMIPNLWLLGPFSIRASSASRSTFLQPKRAWAGRRARVRNSCKASVFRRWVIDLFGRELLHKGTGALDIAGGKGELAFEILNLNDAPATVIDPRPLQLKMPRQRLIKGVYHRNVPMQKYVDTRAGAAPRDPDSLRCFFQRFLWEPPSATHEEAYLASCAEAARTAWTRRGLERDDVHEDGEPGGEDEAADVSRTLSTAAPAVEQPLHDDCEMLLSEVSGTLGCCVDDELSEDSCRDAAACSRTAMGNGHDGSGVPVDAGRLAATDAGVSSRENRGRERKQKVQRQLRARKRMAEAAASEAETSELGGGGPGEDPSSLGLSLSYQDARRRVLECSIVLGLHPDQAAEAAVDFALECNKPFAVVPCCTYYNEFTKRRLPDGRPVRTYEELIEYLVAKSPRCQLATLDFEGKNKVIYGFPT